MTRFARMVRSVGRRRGLSDTDLDDLVQDVRIRLWRGLAESENIERVRASYVYRAALSAALDMVRRARARPEVPLDGEAIEWATRTTTCPPDVGLERRELRERIDRVIGGLAEPRDVVVRLHLSGYDRFEIARLLGWTEPKVRNLLYRGLNDLRTRLVHEGIGPGATRT